MRVSSYDGEKIDRAITIIKEALVNAESEIADMKYKLNLVIPQKMEIIQCNCMGKVRVSIESYFGDRWKTKASVAKKHAQKLLDEAEVIHNKNAPAIKNNQAARDALIAFMNQIGIERTYNTYEFKTSRSSKKTKVTHTAGWFSDMVRCLPVDDGWEEQQKSYQEYLKRIRQYEEKMQQAENLEKAELEKESKRKEFERLLAVLVVKYDLPSLTDRDGVLDNILSQNKYLMLAHHLLENRTDYSDGPDSARYGLQNFTVENEVDGEIYDNINFCITEWDGDGRIFRDCEWNYDRLFSLAADHNPELVNDYRQVSEYMA